MSVGLQLLRAIIELRDRTTMRSLSPDIFLPDEMPAYEFVGSYYRRHGELPTVAALAENGIRLLPATSPPGYYLERARSRAVFNTVQQEQPQLAEAMRTRDMEGVMDVLGRMLGGASRFRSQQNTHTLAELARQVLTDYQHAHTHPGTQGITLGWEWLDELTGGAEPGDLITLAARPGMGKSWLLTHMARQAWLRGSNVLFVTMEMTGLQIARRMLGAEAGVNPDLVRRGQLSMWTEPNLYEAVARVEERGRWHMITGSFKESVPVVDAAIQEFSPDIVYIDASYLMRPPSGSFKAQWEMLSAVQQALKDMAMQRHVPIVQTTQFNREAAKTKQRGTEHLGGTDDIGRISTVGIDVNYGDAPNESSQRVLRVFKNRERENGEFACEFLFNPPSFNFLAAGDADARREMDAGGVPVAAGPDADPTAQPEWEA